MQRVLVTGGTGFVGANATRALLSHGYDVRVVDDLSVGRPEYLRGLDVEVHRADILDRSALRRAMRGVDAVVHLAALSGVAPSVAHPERDFEMNVRGTFNVVDTARRAGVGHVIVASSGAVLAGSKPPLGEDMPPSPLSPYGASKLYGEGLLLAYGASYGMVGVALRFSNLYGRYSSHKSSVIAAFMRRVAAGRPLAIYGSGRQTRDFLHVDDVGRAVVKSLQAHRGGVFQLGTGVETTVTALARMVSEVAGVPLAIERHPPRTAEARRNFTDISKARARLGWQPRIELRDGLADTYEWLTKARATGT